MYCGVSSPEITSPSDRARLGTTEVAVLVAAKVAQHFWPAISYADVFLTEDCNHRCTYCFVKGKNPQKMSVEIARDTLEFLVKASKQEKQVRILFFGGEPLLEFDLIRFFIEYGRERFKQVGKELGFDMTTNGTLMTEEMAKYFRDNGVMCLLSVDGDKETHDANRKILNGGSSFEALMERLPVMKRYQPWQGARITVHPKTVHKLRHNVELLYHCGINQFIIGPATGIEWSEEALRTYEEQMCSVADLYGEMKQKGLPFRMTLFEKNLECDEGHLKGIWGCGAGRGRICISVKGELYGCAKILGVDGLRDTHKLGDIWNGITALTTRRDLLNTHPSTRPQCVVCPYADDCAGGCPATNYEATGNIFDPAPLECALVPIIKRIKVRVNGALASSEGAIETAAVEQQGH